MDAIRGQPATTVGCGELGVTAGPREESDVVDAAGCCLVLSIYKRSAPHLVRATIMQANDFTSTVGGSGCG